MLEIEMKFRVADVAAYEKLLAETLNAVLGEPTTEADVFFTNEALGFPTAGKALRIRRRGNYLATTFKGPKLDKLTKTREEIELPLIDEREDVNEENTKRVDEALANWIKFYNRLGFARYGEVVKTRRRAKTTYGGYEFEITLDKLEGVGYFTELEVTAEKEDFENAKLVVTSLAGKLELTESITSSYLCMVNAKDRYIVEHDAK